MGAIALSSINGFTPFQITLSQTERLERVTTATNDVFENQDSNVRAALVNTLDSSEYKKIALAANLPEETMKTLYNEIAQKQLEKALMEMKGQKFSVDYDNDQSFTM